MTDPQQLVDDIRDFLLSGHQTPLDTLQALATESAARLVDLVDTLPEPSTRIETSSGMRAAATILTQLVMHGVEHRAHVGTILGANGIEPPDLDSWAHGIWVHGDDWPPGWGPDRRGDREPSRT